MLGIRHLFREGCTRQLKSHLRGDGTYLPTNWTSGLAYYCSYDPDPGLRIRYGIDVHVDENGKKQGDFTLATAPLSSIRGLVSRIQRKLGLVSYVSEIVPNRRYAFRARVHPEMYSLTVWPAGKVEPVPQVVLSNPPEMLKHGAVGILAHQVGVRLYSYAVSPLTDIPGL